MCSYVCGDCLSSFQVRCLWVCWERPAEGNTVSYRCSRPGFLTFAMFFQTFAKDPRFCSFLFPAWCQVLFNSFSGETQSCESACHYSQLQISLHTPWFTDAEVVAYGLCLRSKEIFEKLRSKENSSLFWAKGVSKVKTIFIKAGPSYMKFLIVFTPLVENSRWPANWN